MKAVSVTLTSKFLRNTFIRSIALMLVLMVAAGCGGGGRSGGGGSGGPNTSIDGFIQRYVQYTKERNSEALANMYTDPADLTEFGHTRRLTRAEIKAQFDMVFTITTTVYDSQARNVSATVSGDTATVQFTWMQDVYNSALGQRVKTEGDKTWILKRIGGQWYISHEKS